jgi:hypothetical protein
MGKHDIQIVSDVCRNGIVKKPTRGGGPRSLPVRGKWGVDDISADMSQAEVSCARRSLIDSRGWALLFAAARRLKGGQVEEICRSQTFRPILVTSQ